MTTYSNTNDFIISEPNSEPSEVYQCSVCNELFGVDEIFYVRIKAETITVDGIICKDCWPDQKRNIQQAEEIYEHLDPKDAPMYDEEFN